MCGYANSCVIDGGHERQRAQCRDGLTE